MTVETIIEWIVEVLVIVLPILAVPILKQVEAWRDYPHKSRKEKIKIGFWNLRFMGTMFGIVHSPECNIYCFVSLLAAVNQVPKYTAFQMLEEKPQVYTMLWRKIEKGEVEITSGQQFAKELQKIELELLKHSCPKRRRKKNTSSKFIRRRSVHPGKKMTSSFKFEKGVEDF